MLNRNYVGFCELSNSELHQIDGGFIIFGIAIAGATLLKVALAGITVGAGAVAVYYGTKK